MDPIGLYIHIPYCLHKCGYCDFNSHPENAAEREVYVPTLIDEIRHYAPRLQGRRVGTIFFGGGTPTTLPAGDQIRILKACKRHFEVMDDAEITTEANPSTVETENLKCLRAAGINRLSVGVQSFDADELKALDRVHSVEEIHQTVERARTAGFDNLSLDLMFALPGQTRERWQDNLEQAIAKNPEHLSTYNLTIEPGTAFHKLHEAGQLTLPEDDFQLELYQYTIERLQQAGYDHYEISNFARPGRESRHNIIYWENGDTLGLGAGASSYLDGVRFKNFNTPAHYIDRVKTDGHAVQTEETLDARRAMGETLMLGLRLKRGVSIPKFERRFDVPFSRVYGPVLERLLKQDLILMQGDRLALSPRGLFLADSVILEFIE
ncbi:radical SAM family heme chaperone HemW [Nitrospina watsonii]|uniref:Heme chaperone HemW n=1 Tax=Nitrospina watsonii TaxID=1323948 RepID=A0ABN8VVR1_9BACT|nr:radical SAM family heme chaperone HemW [Nitrospina watsonii]CAI2717902.1 Heme chaperone HemW [Nitrospina watsonii]